MSNDEFYVGYGPLPSKDRRFLLGAIPLTFLGIGALGLGAGVTAKSSGGGRWLTGDPVTLTGRISFSPYPMLWTSETDAVILAGIGKVGADPIASPFGGQVVEAKGIRIVRDDCTMLGVAAGDIQPVSNVAASVIPEQTEAEPISMIGEVLDAQCFMGVMNPGYGRTHRGCAAQCIRGGQPVFFSLLGSNGPQAGPGCAGQGFLLADAKGNKANTVVRGLVGKPVVLEGTQDQIGSFKRIRIAENGLLPV